MSIVAASPFKESMAKRRRLAFQASVVEVLEHQDKEGHRFSRWQPQRLAQEGVAKRLGNIDLVMQRDELESFQPAEIAEIGLVQQNR